MAADAALCACAAVASALARNPQHPRRLAAYAALEFPPAGPFAAEADDPLGDAALIGDAPLLAEALEFAAVRAWRAGHGLAALPTLAMLRYVTGRVLASAPVAAHAAVLTVRGEAGGGA